MPDGELRRCVQSVLALGQDLDGTSIAEALWLAATASADVNQPAVSVSADPADARSNAEAPTDRSNPIVRRPGMPDQKETSPQEPDVSSGIAGVMGRRVRVQHGNALPQALDLSRSLRPFKRRWPQGRRLQLDVDTTVRSYARTLQLLPEFRPAPERWFEVDIVVDDSPSMEVWGEVVSGLSTLLHQLGAFRNIRTWRLSLSGTVPALHNEGGQVSGTGELRAPGGRRLIIVVSDGSAPAWFQPEVWQMVRAWAGSTPTALISPLSTRLWGRTGLSLPAVRVGPGSPGSANTQLPYVLPGALGIAEGHDEDWLPLPAATLSAHMLGRWARMLMKGDPRGCDALLIPARRHMPENRAGDADDNHVPGEQLADAFCRTASPLAARLAVLCAPFSAVSLPLLRFICDAIVRGASTGDLAEVMVGGLFLPPAYSPDGGVLRFRRGVRERLGEILPESDAWQIYEALRQHIITSAGLSATFPAGIPDPLGDISLPAELLPFAAASREALEFLDALPEDSGEQALITVTPPAYGQFHRMIWGGVPPRDPYFTGRDDLFEHLRHKLHRSITAVQPEVPLSMALQGLGGIGKTAVAVEYAHRWASDYDLIWWISADQVPLVRSSLAELATQLGLEEANAGINDAATAALDALHRGAPHTRWLLIFDGADQPEEIADLIPRGPGHVLITSRNYRWAPVVDVLQTDVFARRESVAFLTRRSPVPITLAEADRLAEQLGDLPLSLAQAAAMLAETGMTVNDYLRLLDEHVTQIFALGRPLEYPTPVTAAFTIAIARLRESAPEAIELLRHLAFFGPDPIPQDVFLSGAMRSGTSLANPVVLARAIEILRRYSLVTIEDSAISIHRLIAALIRDDVGSDEGEVYRHQVHLLLAAAAPSHPEDSTQWTRYGELAPHVASPATGLARCADPVVRAFVLSFLDYLYTSGDLASYRSIAQHFIGQWTDDSGADHPDVLMAQRHLSEALRALGERAETNSLTEAASRLRFRILGPLEIRTGEDWRGIGAPKWRSVLAALLIHAGQIVSADTLISEVWGDEPPARSANLISIYVLRLRRLMDDPDGRLLVTSAPGYQLRVTADDTDALLFQAMVRDGRQALAAGDPRAAVGGWPRPSAYGTASRWPTSRRRR